MKATADSRSRSHSHAHGGGGAARSIRPFRASPARWCFTTHTPVPAGHDRFHADLIEEHLGPLRESLGISHDRLMALGRENPGNYYEQFCMTVVGAEAFAARQRGFVAAWRGFARHVDGPFSRATRRRGSDRTHHERRACAVLAGAADVPALRPASGQRDGTSTAAKRGPGRESRVWTTASSGKRTSA